MIARFPNTAFPAASIQGRFNKSDEPKRNKIAAAGSTAIGVIKAFPSFCANPKI